MIKESNFSFKTRVVNSSKRKWDIKYPNFFNKKCHYLEALYSSLIYFKPKYCLEIGTHKGNNSTMIFQKYFDNFCKDGLLITVDIIPCDNLDYKNIKQVIVYPHHNNIEKTCGNSGKWFLKKDLIENFENKITKEQTIYENISLIKKAMTENKIDLFDFAFIDGDHEVKSIKNDIKISKNLTKYPHNIFIDDTKEEYHPCCHYYQEIIKKDKNINTYDFDDWNKFVGASLISFKE